MPGNPFHFANRLKLAQKASVLIAVPLVFEVALVGSLLYLQHRTELEIEKESHARQITDMTNKLFLHLAETWMQLTQGKKGSLQISEMNGNPVDAIQQDLISLRAMVRTPKHLETVEYVQSDFNQMLQAAEQLKKEVVRNPLTAQLKVKEAENIWRDRMAGNINRMDVVLLEERQIERQSPIAQARFRQSIRDILTFAIPFNILLAIALAYYFNKTIADRLAIVIRNTRALAENKPLEPQVDGADEIAILDKAFHETVLERRKIDSMKQDFVNMVSHDLRTPLTSLKAITTMFADGTYGEISASGQNILAQANGSLTRLIALINDLLEVEKMESGELKIDKRSCSIVDVIKEATDVLFGYAEQQCVAVSFEAPSELIVEADKDRIVQVATNLISNAIKFSPPQSTVKVSCALIDGVVQVSIHDSGPGLSPEQQSIVFEKFTQLHHQSSQSQFGSGLGLAICKKIVELHGGIIGVNSKVGEGSVFWFRLPAAAAPAIATS